MRNGRKEKERDWKLKDIKVKGFIGLNSVLLKPTEWLKYTNDKFLFPEINKKIFRLQEIQQDWENWEVLGNLEDFYDMIFYHHFLDWDQVLLAPLGHLVLFRLLPFCHGHAVIQKHFSSCNHNSAFTKRTEM